MRDPSKIRAKVSATTKEQLDRFARQRGLERDFVVEQALLYFMESRRDLPDEAMIPTRLRLSEETFDRVAAALENPPLPTKALRELMTGSR